MYSTGGGTPDGLHVQCLLCMFVETTVEPPIHAKQMVCCSFVCNLVYIVLVCFCVFLHIMNVLAEQAEEWLEWLGGWLPCAVRVVAFHGGLLISMCVSLWVSPCAFGHSSFVHTCITVYIVR